MSEERKVVCRCGREMVLNTHARNSGDCTARYACVCGWMSPVGRAISDMELAIERAYLAATATPPNLPLTREQVEAMPDLAAVWEVPIGTWGNVMIRVTSAEWAKCQYEDVYGIEWGKSVMLFSAPPTPADISAARAGKGEENAD